jgi:two-component system, NtrC family, nitrogen regulation sensor histidine kinase NtrY
LLINNYIERFKFLGIALILLLSAIMVESSFFEQHFNESKAQRFRNVLIRKDENATILLNEIAKRCQTTAAFSEIENLYTDKSNYNNRHGVSFIVYKSQQSFFWSNNSFYFPSIYDSSFFSKPVIFIDHTWFYIKSKAIPNYNIIVFIAIKDEYPYQNKLLTNEFHDDFTISPTVKISTVHLKNGFVITDKNGKYLMSLSRYWARNTNVFQRNFAVALYFLSFMMIIFFMGNYLKKFRTLWIADFTNVGFLLFILLFRWLMVHYRFPFIFRIVPLFDSQYFAYSERFPSLGDLLIDVMFLWYFVNQLHKRFKQGLIFRYNKKVGKVLVYIMPVLISMYGFWVDLCIKRLVVDSNINFEAHKVLDISNMSIFGYLIMAILVYTFVLAAHGFIYSLSKRYDFKTGLLIFLPGFVVSVLMLIKENPFFVMRISALLLTFFLVLFAVNYRYKNEFSFSLKVLVLIISSIFITLSVDYYLEAKHFGIKKIYAQNLANEQDELTEQMIRESEQKIRIDNVLKNYMHSPFDKEDIINKYLRNKYFGGFLNKYRLETTICGNSGLFKNENQIGNCDNYFKQFIFQKGKPLNNCNFYFLNNQDGSISYVDSLTFVNKENTIKLYIELKSRLLTEELGYPELLINEKNRPKNIFKEYSFARYKNGKLVNQQGNYKYSLSSEKAQNVTVEFTLFTFNNYDHLFYNIPNSDGMVIVVSAPETTLIQILISISYVFLFFFLLLMCMEFASAAMNQSLTLRLNFKGKIQASFIGVLVLSLILIGISMIYLNLDQYKVTQYEHVNDKLQSILVELEQYSERRNPLDPNMNETITFKLTRLSNTYFTDINLYDLQGNLITSSRMEIYNQGLIGPKMNIDALSALSERKQTIFENIERIGELEYLSAYAVLKNKDNEPIAYLNIPYFTKQDTVSQRLSSLVVAFINIYVLLIVIATLIAVFISNKVTQPLFILKEKIRHIKLRGKNENIEWESNDEIGGLINDYNRMVRELSASAEKLAENEREMAWREMAKQIAHEIKNPLTPMKLNIQLLNRAWDTKSDDFDDRLKRVSQTLLEQIDNLAATATEFSNFAKISHTHSEPINLIERIEHCIELFSNEQDIRFTKNYNNYTELIIHIDKDKLNRVFINIIKNAIQSIPKDKEGVIVIDVKSSENKITTQITDNGTGINIETQKHLFEPNFTTKSSGSGLGLAIVKNIVQSFNGRIWFETQEGVGTSFFIEFDENKLL